MKKINLDNKKTLVLSIVTVLTLILVVIGATYAYFVAQGGSSSQADVSVKTATTDVLILSTGEEINITADQFTFGKDMGNRDGSTYAKAELRANNSTNNAKANYYVYLDIKENSFIYTTENKTAELILTVTDPDGNPVTKVNGLEYVTVNGISGFDVTDKSGLFTIVDNHEIVSTGTKIENWNVVLTLVNLDSDQSQNAGNGLKAVLEITKDAKSKDSTLASLIKSQYTGTQGENNLYLHDSTLENGAGDGSYRYSGTNETTNNFVCFGYDSNDGSCPDDYLYRIIGLFGNNIKLVKYEYAKSTLLGLDGNYKEQYKDDTDSDTTGGYVPQYKGSNSTGELGMYVYSNDTNDNAWKNSKLNTINLNTNYLNNLGSKWRDMIAEHTWIVGGFKIDEGFSIYGYVTTPANLYADEVASPASNEVYVAKIGLMYMSDYMFTAEKNSWTVVDDFYSEDNKWISMGLSFESLITPRVEIEDGVRHIYIGQQGGIGYMKCNTAALVRPTFYLKDSIKSVGGDGTKSSPYLLS